MLSNLTQWGYVDNLGRLPANNYCSYELPHYVPVKGIEYLERYSASITGVAVPCIHDACFVYVFGHLFSSNIHIARGYIYLWVKKMMSARSFFLKYPPSKKYTRLLSGA